MADDDALTAALAEIRDREKRATPGPWGWFGNTDVHSVYLATRTFGRLAVMGFARWGMSGAKPLFATGRRWKPNPDSIDDFASLGVLDGPEKLPVFEVAPSVTDRKHPDVYRADITGIRAPDAEFIAHSRADVARLLAALHAALKFHRPLHLYAEVGAASDDDGPCRHCGHDQEADCHFELDTGDWVCSCMPQGTVCETCGPEDATDSWPCDEYQAIARALTGEDKPGD